MTQELSPTASPKPRQRGLAGRGGATMTCPICRHQARVDSSEGLSHLSRRVYYQCRDINCGHTFTAILEFEKTLSPSAHGPVNRNAPLLKLKDRPDRPPIGGHGLPPPEAGPPPG